LKRTNKEVFKFLKRALGKYNPKSEQMATTCLKYFIKYDLTDDQLEMLESVKQGLNGQLCDNYYVDQGHITIFLKNS